MVKNVLKLFVLPLSAIFIISSCSSISMMTSSKNRKTEKNRQSYYTSHSKKRTAYTRSSARRATTTNNSQRDMVVQTAKKYIGKPYIYGGKKPSSGFDCSGFTTYVFQQNGIPVNGASHSQARLGKRKSKRELEEGDLVFFGSSNKVSHVGIVASVEADQLNVIHSTSSRGVVIDNISQSDYWQKRYLFGRDVLE